MNSRQLEVLPSQPLETVHHLTVPRLELVVSILWPDQPLPSLLVLACSSWPSGQTRPLLPITDTPGASCHKAFRKAIDA